MLANGIHASVLSLLALYEHIHVDYYDSQCRDKKIPDL